MRLRKKKQAAAVPVEEFVAVRDEEGEFVPADPENLESSSLPAKVEVDINIEGLDAEEVSLARDKRVIGYR